MHERQAQILQALYLRRSDTMANLAEEFHVCRQTIKNDIDTLSLTHPEIIVRPGRHRGGVFIREDFRAERKYFTPKEVALLERLKTDLQGDDLCTMQEILNRYTA